MDAQQLEALGRLTFEIRRERFPGKGWSKTALWKELTGHDWQGMSFTAAAVALTLGAQDPRITSPRGLFFMDRPHWSKAAAETGESDTVPVVRCRDPRHQSSSCQSPMFALCRSEILAGHRPERMRGLDNGPLHDTPKPGAPRAPIARPETAPRPDTGPAEPAPVASLAAQTTDPQEWQYTAA